MYIAITFDYFGKLLQFIWDKVVQNPGLATMATVAVVFVGFWWRRKNERRDAARIVLQEIRRAEDIISDYKQSGGYQFAKKIIATNSWGKNLHLFVGDLDSDELDRISNLYSTGEYLDALIKEISDYTFEKEIGKEDIVVTKPPATMLSQENQQQSVTVNPAIHPNTPQIKLIKIDPPWKPRLDLITLKLESIYHSTICYKLKKIAKLK